MAWVKRLRLEQNWPLAVAVAAVPIAGLYLIFRMLSPLDYPEWQTGTVVYPLLLFYQNTAFILVAASLIGLSGILLRTLWLHIGEVGCGSIILALVAVIVLTALTGWMGIVLFFVLLMWIVYPQTREVHQFRRDNNPEIRIYKEGDTLDCADLFPGLVLTMETIFKLPAWALEK